jgi:predicted alpha/beta superfamily hydrolase
MSRRRRKLVPSPGVPPTDAPPYERHYHHDFASAWLGNARTVTVALPPGYHTHESARYPVFYLHDGQNLFEPHEAAFGTCWDADRTAARLIAAHRLRPVILVGVANTPDRMSEYAVHYDPHEQAGGKGRLYARFVLDEVKPFVDQRYRTLPDRAHTAVGGSSMGGLVSLTMAHEHSDRIGLCAALSPSLWWKQAQVLSDLGADRSWLRRTRFWLDMGTREGSVRGRGHVTPSIERTRRLAALFDDAGLLPGRDYYYQEVAGGEHNEAAWAARFDKVLLFFFGKRDTPLADEWTAERG